MRVRAGSSVRWPLTISSDQKEVSVHFDVATNSDNAPEWNVFLNTGKDELWSNYYSKMDYKLSLPVADLNLEVQCPRGVRYDDFVDVTVTVDEVTPSHSGRLQDSPFLHLRRRLTRRTVSLKVSTSR